MCVSRTGDARKSKQTTTDPNKNLISKGCPHRQQLPPNSQGLGKRMQRSTERLSSRSSDGRRRANVTPTLNPVSIRISTAMAAPPSRSQVFFPRRPRLNRIRSSSVRDGKGAFHVQAESVWKRLVLKGSREKSGDKALLGLF